MKKQLKAAALLLALFCIITSCTREEEYIEPSGEETATAYLTDSVHYPSKGLTAYNFVYPSQDPQGRPTMLSGSITIGDEVTRQEEVPGLILYNHYTAYRADQCPSQGDLSVQTLLAPSGLITISADYYGFGETENAHQAYCISRANAQSSIDALLAAKVLLDSMGFTWADQLFNIGYSQGAQTAMGVVRLVDEAYPDIHLSYTFAGAGPYDIPETYRQFLGDTTSGMPSTIISVLLSYNEFYQLHVPYNQMFLEPLLSNIDEWIFSKLYKREEIDEMIGAQLISDYLTPTLLDTTTEVSQRLMAAMDDDNLCKNWSPRENEKIYLFHNTQDITVPVVNTANLHQFLTHQGLNNVMLDTANYGGASFMPAHEIGAIPFMARCVGLICTELGITPWVK